MEEVQNDQEWPRNRSYAKFWEISTGAQISRCLKSKVPIILFGTVGFSVRRDGRKSKETKTTQEVALSVYRLI